MNKIVKIVDVNGDRWISVGDGSGTAVLVCKVDDVPEIMHEARRLAARVEWFKALVSEMNEYLNTNKRTNIESSSIFHAKIIELLNCIGKDNE